MQTLASDLRQFLNIEFEAQRQATHDTWRLPLKLRVQKGEALDGIEVLGAKVLGPSTPGTFFISREDLLFSLGKRRIRFRGNASKFKPGSYVRLHRGNPFDPQNSFGLEVLSVSESEMLLEGEYTPNINQVQPGPGWVLDSNVVDLRKFMYQALDRLEQESNHGLLANVLLYREAPVFDESARTIARQLMPFLGLNAQQAEAFINAYAAKNYYLIQGPPGTGKTRVLALLATALARQGQRVLVTSFTHRGINNALRKIHETTGYPHVMKVGKAAEAEDLGDVRNAERRPDLSAIDGQAYIVGATAFALWTSRLTDTEFDVIIFDEASQVNQVQAAAAMLRGQKFIFIGDHQQMPPIIAGEHADPLRRQSIFEYLFTAHPGTMLSATYRMHADLAHYASQHFYGGQLQSHSSAAGRTLRLPKPATSYADILSSDSPGVFLDLGHRNAKTSEYNEAWYVADLIRELLACGVPAREIAVVAPFRAQGALIRRQLRHRCSTTSPEELAEILVDTVEKMQGQERDVVLISLTNGLFDERLQRAEFYFLPNRLNVAITRARCKRIVVGSSNLFDTQLSDGQWQQWVHIFQDFCSAEPTFHLPLVRSPRPLRPVRRAVARR
ncbi:DEAD/DEAH box helicase [Hymenobacter tenuis]